MASLFYQGVPNSNMGYHNIFFSFPFLRLSFNTRREFIMGQTKSVPMSTSLAEKLDKHASVEEVFEEDDFLLQFDCHHEKITK